MNKQELSSFDPRFDHSKCYFWCGNPYCESAPKKCEVKQNMSQMAEESLEAYFSKVQSGSLEADKERVYQYILAHKGACIWQAAEHFHVSDNRISGRFIELIREGRIRKSDTVTLINPSTRKRARLYIPL